MSVGSWLGLLGLVAVPIVVLIYLIKSKYVPKTVSSTFIWQRSLKYMKRRVPIKFIMSLLLIVQILVVLAATTALMNIKTEPRKSDASIVIVDASSSMKAMNGDKTRYEVALEKLRVEADKVGENSAMVIIIASEVPEVLTQSKLVKEDGTEVLTPYEYNKDNVMAVIDQKLVGKCTNTTTDINAALELAQTAVDMNKEAKIYLYTDRLYDDPDIVNIINCADSENDWNAGITTFTDSNLAAGYEFTANIINEGKEAEFIVSLTVDGSSVVSKKITMGKSETKQIVFSPRSTENSDAIKIKSIKNYENAKIEINTETDIISDDNTAYLYAVPEADIRILYVSSALKASSSGGVDFLYQTTLQRSLGANGYVINSTDIYHSSQVKSAPTTGYDLYIYEGVMPASMPEDGAVWYINAPSSPVGTNIEISDVVKDAAAGGNTNGYEFAKSNIVLGPNGQLINKNVDFDDPVQLVIDGKELIIQAAVSKYRVIGVVDEKTGMVTYEIPENFEEVYSCTYYGKITNEDGSTSYPAITTPVMLVGTVGTTRTIITTFDFTQSSLPVFIADFPVLLKNMIEYSMPEILPERTPTIGDKLEFNAPAGVETITYYYKTFEEETKGDKTNGVEVNRWDGTTADLPEVVLDKLGIYNIVVQYKPEIVIDGDGGTIENRSEPDTYSISTYMPLSESDITEKGPRLYAPTPGDEATIDRHGRSILWVFVLVLAIFIIIEWAVYYRDEY